jgi:hypothetical protein
MVADRIPNPRREGSTPSTDAFPIFTDIGSNNWQLDIHRIFSRVVDGPGDLPCGAARAPGKTPGRTPGNRPWGSQRPGDVNQLWASG